MPYNVAFKLVTVERPADAAGRRVLLRRGLRAPWPAPPAFAIAALGMLVQTRSDWQIYGGNIASTLAGEFSFTHRARARRCSRSARSRTRSTPASGAWLPAVLIAAGDDVAHRRRDLHRHLRGVLLWLTRRPRRTWRLAVPIGAVAGALTAVWIAAAARAPGLHAEHAVHEAACRRAASRCGDRSRWLAARARCEHTIDGRRAAVCARPLDTNAQGDRHCSRCGCRGGSGCSPGSRSSPPAGTAAAPRSCLLVLAIVIGVMFVEWPEHAVWNTRFLPFWLLTWGFLAAMGATEIARLVAHGRRQRVQLDPRRRPARRARRRVARRRDGPTTTSVDAGVARGGRRGRSPSGASTDAPPDGSRRPRLQPRAMAQRRRLAEIIVLAIAGRSSSALFGVNRGVGRAQRQPGDRDPWLGRVELHRATSEEAGVGSTHVGRVQRDHGGDEHAARTAARCGSRRRCDGDPINSYGTSLALELLPYFTNGRIGSMEGLYFESSATTSIHFLTVAEIAKHPSNPVRGPRVRHARRRLRPRREAPADARRALPTCCGPRKRRPRPRRTTTCGS